MAVMTAKKNFSFLCDHASVTKNGKLNMNGIFENINARKFPIRLPVMYVVINISGASDGDTLTCEMTAREKPKKKLIAIRAPVKVDPDKKFGFIGQIANVVFEGPGDYLLKFFIDNKNIGEHPFSVRELK